MGMGVQLAVDLGDRALRLLARSRVLSARRGYRGRQLATCSKRCHKAGTQKRFGGMMGERFKRDANNGYPRYLGVRAKPIQPQLRVVSSH